MFGHIFLSLILLARAYTSWRKESGLTRQLLVGEQDEVLYFKLPGAKKKQNKHKHNIMDAVDNARGAEKKH